MNVKRISKPVTPYNQDYKRREVAAMHPAMQRQVFLDHHEMAYWAQSRIHNDCAGTISAWMDTLD